VLFKSLVRREKKQLPVCARAEPTPTTGNDLFRNSLFELNSGADEAYLMRNAEAASVNL
jgi:hypothetical protein